jgi:dynein heavy chain
VKQHYQHTRTHIQDTTLFCRGIAEAPPAAAIEERCVSIIEYYTYMLYCNVCRSLFEAHKLMFSFLLCIKILQGDSLVDALEWRFLISGMSLAKYELANPDPSWIESNVWDEILNMTGGLPFFADFADSFAQRVAEWKTIFDSSAPQDLVFPAPFDELKMSDPKSGLRRLCIVRCLRRDKLMDAVQAFVLEQSFMGRKYVEPPPMNLKDCFNDSSTISKSLLW